MPKVITESEVIERVRANKLQRIYKVEDLGHKFGSATLEFDDGEAILIDNEAMFYDILGEYVRSSGKTYPELLTEGKLAIIGGEPSREAASETRTEGHTEEHTEEHTESHTEGETHDEEEEEEDEERRSGLSKKAKGWIVGITSTSIALLIAFFLVRWYLNKKNNPYTGKTITYTQATPTKDPNNAVAKLTDLEAGSRVTYDDVMRQTRDRASAANKLIYDLSSGGKVTCTEDDILALYTDISRYCNANIASISNFINGGKIDKNETVYSFDIADSFATEGARIVVENFSNSLAKIKAAAYGDQNRSTTKTAAESLLTDIAKFVDGEPIGFIVNGQQAVIYYENLPGITKLVINELGKAVASMKLDGYKYGTASRKDLANAFNQNSTKLAMQIVDENKVKNKK